ncbi:MAG: secretin N-terminal domain-containing protein [Pseudomonadota bacterium]
MRVLALAFCLAAPIVAGSSVATAQSSPTRATSTVNDIIVIAESREQVVFRVAISPAVGTFSAVNTEASRPTVQLAGAARSRALPSHRQFRGLVQSVDLESTDTGLAIRFNATAPAKASAEKGGPDRILVTISKLTGAEALGSRPVGSENDPLATAHSLPAAPDYYPGDTHELVMLKYADVSEIVGLLSQGATIKPNNVFIRREPGFGSMSATSGTTYVSPGSQGTAEAQPLGEPVDAGMAVDRRLNAIWLRGSPDYIARMKAMIEDIDQPVDSVILETQFVELTESGTRNLGIDFNNAAGQIGVATVTRGAFVPFGADPNKTLVGGSVQAALYAQVARGNGRIVSSPRIAAQSGDTAKILTGDALPILTSIALSGVNAVSQQVQYVNVGVTLQIAPRVSPDGFVTSHIYAVVSSVTGFQQGYPTISQREAETSASVRDGETFVIGGLTIDNYLSNKSKLPILGDIPLIGQAFRLDKTSKNKTDLYVVITPHVVRHRRAGDFDAPTAAPPADVGVTRPRSTETPLIPPQGLPDLPPTAGNPPRN